MGVVRKQNLTKSMSNETFLKVNNIFKTKQSKCDHKVIRNFAQKSHLTENYLFLRK